MVYNGRRSVFWKANVSKYVIKKKYNMTKGKETKNAELFSKTKKPTEFFIIN